MEVARDVVKGTRAQGDSRWCWGKAAGLWGLRPALQDLASLAGMRLSAPLQRLGEARGTQAEACATGMSTGVGAWLDW